MSHDPSKYTTAITSSQFLPRWAHRFIYSSIMKTRLEVTKKEVKMQDDRAVLSVAVPKRRGVIRTLGIEMRSQMQC